MNRMQFDLSQTEDYSPEDNFSYNSEEPLWRSMVFSTVLYLVRIKNIKQVRDTFLQGFKSQVSMYTVSLALAPGKGILSKRRTSIGFPGRETFNFYF